MQAVIVFERWSLLLICSVRLIGYFKYSGVIVLLNQFPYGKTPSTFATSAVTRQELASTVAKWQGVRGRTWQRKLCRRGSSAKLNGSLFSLWWSQWAVYNVC